MLNLLKQNKIAILLLFIAVLFILCGIYRQELAVVWQKASAICLECIGIG